MTTLIEGVMKRFDEVWENYNEPYSEGELIRKFISTEIKRIMEEAISDIRVKFVQFAIKGKNDKDNMKGILLYLRMLEYLSGLKKENKSKLGIK